VTGPTGTAKIEIPRWIQLVGLPLLLILAWALAGAVRHAIFVFLVASLVALLLSPLVKGVERTRIPRGFAVAFVYLLFATAVVSTIAAVTTVVIDQSRSAADRIDTYVTEENGRTGRTGAEQDIDDFQAWLDDHGIELEVRKEADQWLEDADVGKYTSQAIDFLEGAAFGILTALFTLVLVIVVSIYMLLDMHRLSAAVDRRFPPRPGGRPLMSHIEWALAGYVKGQVLLSLIMGTSAGVGMWLLGTLGWVRGGDDYALLFGAWVAVTELVPYVGPWLGAIPPFIYALVDNPISSLWVAALFLFMHQIEGHVVVPNVMANALRLHPLLVIFGLLAGFEVYGIAGALLALPTLAVARATWEFFAQRVTLESWGDAEGVVPVEVEVEPETRATIPR
jgi:predicted PurR-regulated permease PerM